MSAIAREYDQALAAYLRDANSVPSEMLERLAERLGLPSPTDEILAGLRRAHSLGRVRHLRACLLYTSPSPRDRQRSRMPSSA